MRVSSSVSSSSTMVPRSGRSSPAIMLISEVLPEPDAPNRPVTRPSLVEFGVEENSPSCLVTSTRSMVISRAGVGGAPREPFGGDQRAHRDHDGDDHEARCSSVAVRRLDQRVDRGRNGLGLAGNIGDEGDGRAELADRLGKAEHHAGEHARQRQRQRYRCKHPPGRGAERLDACSSRRSTASIDSRIGRTSSGNDMMPQASAAPVQRNANTMPR